MNEILSLPVMQGAQAFALRTALAGVCVCVVVLIAARLLRRRSEPLQYGILFGGVVGLLAVPALVGLGHYFAVPLLAPAEEEILRIPADMLPDLLHPPPFEPAVEDLAAPAIAGAVTAHGLWMAWALGAAFGMSRLGYACWKLNRAGIRQPWRVPYWTDEMQARLARQLGLRKFPDVFVAPAVPMPLVLGFWPPVIVLPASAPAAWSQAQWEAVLLHEAAHIARRDHWAALAQRVAVVLFWWCPLVVLVSRRLNELRENICDDYALQGPCDHIAYAELLVETAECLVGLKTVPVSLALLDSAHGGLEARITRLLAKEKRPMTKLSLSGKLLGASLLVGACVLTTAATAFSGGAQPAPAKKVQIKILVDGKEIDIHDAKLLEHLEGLHGKPHREIVTKAIVREYAKPGAGALPGELIAPIAVVRIQGDPRIEALVKQAEAIKPGSGAEIRKALAGAPKLTTTPLAVKTWEFKAIEAGSVGKKVIVLQVEDGKAIQLDDAELKKLIEKGMRFNIEWDHRGAPAKPADVWLHHALPAPTAKPAAADIDALRRQLDRITADLDLLRKQINAGKK